MKYFRVWSGDSNDRSEVTNYLFRGKAGLWKAKDIDSAIARARRELITKEARPYIEEDGDDKIAYLTVYEYYDEDGNWLGFEPPEDVEDPNSNSVYISVEEVEFPSEPKAKRSKSNRKPHGGQLGLRGVRR